MKHTLNRRTAAAALVVLLVQCASKAQPTPKWTIDYLPGNRCSNVWVLQNSLGLFAVDEGYVVLRFSGWAGTPKSTTVYVGENLSGPLKLGDATLHDDSNGSDLTGDVIYTTDSESAAKSRADDACGTP